jgi:glycosyltransferase involved in cell wall biosynthesis
MPKVSVIMPMYNASKTVTYSIDALLNQTLSDIEVIVVDDCSPDDEYEICSEKYKDEPRVVLVKQEKNQGPAAARNAAFGIAKGEYITFLDSDDGMVKEGLEKMYNVAKEYDADVVHTTGCYLPVHKPEVCDMMSVPEDFYIHKEKDVNAVSKITVLSDDLAERTDRWIAGEYNGNVWGKMIRKSLIMDNNIRFANLKMSEDIIFAFECLMKAKTYVLFPYKCILYRIIGDSLSKGNKNSSFMVKLLDATLGGDEALSKRMETIPFFVENTNYRKKVLKYVDDAMDSYYITPTYQSVGKEALLGDEKMAAIWERYFGSHASFAERYFYEKQDSAAPAPDLMGNILTYEHCMKLLEKQQKSR